MRVLLLGATGRTGRRVRHRLAAGGHEVVTYGRRPGGGAREMVGPVDDADGLRAALDGVDAIASCLASSNADPVCSTATRTLIAAADRPLRYVLVSGSTVAAAGDVPGWRDRAAAGVMRIFMGGMLADREAEMALLADAPLRWTALRPPRLTDRPGRGAWRFDLDRVRGTALSRDDLAGAVVEALARGDLTGRAPFISTAPAAA